MQQIKKKKDTYKSINSDRLSNKVIKIFYGFKVGLLKMNIPKDENVLQKLIRKIFSKKEAQKEILGQIERKNVKSIKNSSQSQNFMLK